MAYRTYQQNKELYDKISAAHKAGEPLKQLLHKYEMAPSVYYKHRKEADNTVTPTKSATPKRAYKRRVAPELLNMEIGSVVSTKKAIILVGEQDFIDRSLERLTLLVGSLS